MTTKTVELSIDARGVARVTLNRPEKHNAFDDGIIAELRSAFDELAAREDVRVVVLASAGKNFSAGADLGWMQRMAGYDYEHNLGDARLLAGMLQALHDLPQPTIARVQGAAFGGAVGLVTPERMSLNVAIRTALLRRDAIDAPAGELRYHAGCGIVSDSDPVEEEAESLQKVEVLRRTAATLNATAGPPGSAATAPPARPPSSGAPG